MVAITDEKMYKAAQLVFLPLTLLLSFGLCQYLVLTYYNRRKEPRGMLLLGSAFLGFAVLVPLAHPSEELVHHLNDISEACSTLTFLIQITIIGRDTNKKVKIRALHYLTLLAEFLIVLELAVILFDLVEVFDPSIGRSISKEANQVVEDVSLVFIFAFRFYYLALLKGFRDVLATKKMEIAVYALFLTHEYPFLALEASTHVTWEYVQGVYHRLTIVACVWMTLKNKLKNGVLRQTTFHSHRTSQGSQVHASRKSNAQDGGKAPAAKRGPTLALSSAAVAPEALRGPTLP